MHERRDPVEHELAQETRGMLTRRLPFIWYGRDCAALQRIQTTGPRNVTLRSIRPWRLAALPLLQGREGRTDIGIDFLGVLVCLHVARLS